MPPSAVLETAPPAHWDERRAENVSGEGVLPAVSGSVHSQEEVPRR